MKPTVFVMAVAMISGSAAAADPFTDRVITEFRELGFQSIEVKNGPTQVKVEGIRGNREYEVVYDRATGRILKQEQGLADSRKIDRDGVEVQQRDRDFVGADRRRAGRDDDDDDDRRSKRDRDDDDDRSGRRGGDDRDRDDRSGRGGGNDDRDDDRDHDDHDDDDDVDDDNDSSSDDD